MDRDQRLTVQVEKSFNRLFGVEMYIGPVLVVCRYFNEGDIKGPVFLPDLLELAGHARIAAVKDLSPISGHDPGAPERSIPVKEPAAGKVARRSRGNGYAVDLMLIPPCVLINLRLRNTPALKHPGQGEGDVKRRGFCRNGSDCRFVKMVIMVMGDEHRVDCRKVLRMDRRRLKPF